MVDELIPPTWIQAKEEQIWLMCDVCRDQQREWYVQSFGGEINTSALTDAVRQHLENHAVISKDNEPQDATVETPPATASQIVTM